MPNHANHFSQPQQRAGERAGSAATLDPRLIALVKYLAQRAAERDYRASRSSHGQGDRHPGGPSDSK